MGNEASPEAASRRAAASQETLESAGAAGSPGTTADRGSAVPWRAMAWASVALAALVAKAEAGAVIQEVMPTGQYSAGALRPGPAVHAGQPGRHPECLDPGQSSVQRPVDLAERAGRLRRRVHCRVRRAGPGLPVRFRPGRRAAAQRAAAPGPRMAPAGVVAAVRACAGEPDPGHHRGDRLLRLDPAALRRPGRPGLGAGGSRHRQVDPGDRARRLAHLPGAHQRRERPPGQADHRGAEEAAVLPRDRRAARGHRDRARLRRARAVPRRAAGVDHLAAQPGLAAPGLRHRGAGAAGHAAGAAERDTGAADARYQHAPGPPG